MQDRYNDLCQETAPGSFLKHVINPVVAYWFAQAFIAGLLTMSHETNSPLVTSGTN